MAISSMESNKLPKPRYRYSPVVKAGSWIMFSGMIALDAETGNLESGGPGAETRKILKNLRSALPDFSLSARDLAVARIFTTRFDEFPAINTAWEEAFDGSEMLPARTSVGVAALPLGATVEIEFQFYREARS